MSWTTWHITFGTYGSRLHGDERPTVDRTHDIYGTPFLEPDPLWNAGERAVMSAPEVRFTREQMEFVETIIPELCVRGGWVHVASAAGPDHVHVLLNAEPALRGKQVRAVLKRWLTLELDRRWSCVKRSDRMSWWCEGGSTKAVKGEGYFANAKRYVEEQRATGRE